MLGGEFEQDADDLILHDAEPLGAAASVPVLEQQFFRLGAALDQRGFQILRDGGAHVALAPAEFRGELFKIGRGLVGVEDSAAARGVERASAWVHGIAKRRRAVTARRRAKKETELSLAEPARRQFEFPLRPRPK